MNSQFLEQQARERIGGMMREAAEHRLASQAERPERPRILPLLSGRSALARLVHFLHPTHRAHVTAEEQRPVL